MRKKQHHEGQYVPFAFFFVGLFLVIVISSFAWKVISLFQQSSFDGEHQFILATRSPNSQVTDVAVFTPSQKSVSVFKVSNSTDNNSIFPIPFDAEETIPEFNENSPDALVQAILFPKTKTNSSLGIVDVYKLSFFSSTANKTITTISENDLSASSSTNAKAFLDNDLYQEAKTIAVINSTDTSGFGTQVSQMLSLIGCNVISVSGEDSSQKPTTIQYSGEPSYTLSRLERIFHTTATKSTNPSQVADITIVLGKDSLGNF